MTITVPSLAILVSAVLVLSCGQTDRITHRRRRSPYSLTSPWITSKNLITNCIISRNFDYDLLFENIYHLWCSTFSKFEVRIRVVPNILFGRNNRPNGVLVFGRIPRQKLHRIQIISELLSELVKRWHILNSGTVAQMVPVQHQTSIT